MAEREKKKAPGIILFPEYLSIFQEMEPAEVKEIIIAALQYGSGMEETAPKGTTSKIVWILLKQRIEANQENYVKICDNRAYGRYCQVMKDKGKNPLSREEWDEHRQTDLQ